MREYVLRLAYPALLILAFQPTAPAQTSTQLTINIVQGQGSNDLAAQTSVRPRIQVSDAAGRPVAGAQVQFRAPDSGASVHYPDGSVRAFTETDAGGFASAPISVPVNEGEFSIEITVRSGNLTATRTVTQRNVNPCPANMRGLRLEPGPDNKDVHDVDNPAPFTARVRVYRQCLPLSNATVAFSLPTAGSGPGAAFPGSQSVASLQSDAGGYATSPQMAPNAAGGDWDLRVTASAAGESARLAIPEHNTKRVTTTNAKPSNAWKYLLVVAIAGGAVGGLCGSGHCGGSNSTPPSNPCTSNPAACAVGTPAITFSPHK